MPGVVCSACTDHAGTQALIRSPLVDGVRFTGSVAGGGRRAGGGRPIHPVGLELGGNDPAYVRADAKSSTPPSETLVDGAFYNSGQSCCGIQRIYVQRTNYAEFVDRAVALTRQYVLGNPLEAATTLGPVVRASAADAVRATIADAVARGARTLIDTRKFALDVPGSAYVAPEILIDVHHGMTPDERRCFGPSSASCRWITDRRGDRADERQPVWTDRVPVHAGRGRRARPGDRLQTGTVFMNRCDYLDPALAWTGVKNTGATLSTVGYEHPDAAEVRSRFKHL